MCGRFEQKPSNRKMRQIQAEARRVIEQYPLPLEMITGEIRPTDCLPVLVLEDGDGITAVPMRWGFPKWDGKGVIINAKAETANQKPMFRDSLLLRPVAVPTTGFYEWREEPDCAKKRKYLFREHPSRLLYLAGFYNFFPQVPGPVRERFIVLTTAANRLMVDYHHRMPVILREDELERWFGGNETGSFLVREQPALKLINPA